MESSAGKAEPLKKTSKKPQKNRIWYDRFAMAGIFLIVVVLFGVFVVKSGEMSDTLAIYEARAASLEEEIEEEEERTEEIEQLKEYMQTDEYAEEVARDRLGLVKENEIVFEEE